MKKTFILFVFFVLIFESVQSTTWETISYGYWNDGLTWTTGVAPPYSSSDTFIIKHPIVYGDDLIFNSGASVQIDSAGGICGHHTVIVKQNAEIISYGIFEADTLLIEGGTVLFLQPGEVILTKHGQLTVTGAYMYVNCAMEVGLWFDCVQPQYSFATGIEELTMSSFRLYPNPATDKLEIEVPSNLNSPLNLKIFDISGKELIEQHYQISGSDIINVPLNELSNGYYYVQFRTKSSMIKVLPFVVQR